MDRSRHLPKLCFFISIAITLAAVICRTVAMFTAYDTATGYFDPVPLATALTVLGVAGVLLPLIICILIPKGSLPSIHSAPLRHAGVVPTVTFVLGAGAIALAAFKATAISIAPWALILCSVPCALYFVLSPRPFVKDHAGLVILLGFTPIVWSLIALSETYLDPMITINSPVKLSLQAGLAGLMLLTTAELRVCLERSAPRWELALYTVATFLCLNGSIATLAACFSGRVTAPLYVGYATVLLGTGVYAALQTAARLFQGSPQAATTHTAASTPAVAEIPSEDSDSEDAQPSTARGDV